MARIQAEIHLNQGQLKRLKNLNRGELNAHFHDIISSAHSKLSSQNSLLSSLCTNQGSTSSRTNCE